ncbi:DUF4320 family protein [Cytobacillus sp. FSL M8-0252]|uniref:DUF4320 family protein n=1 Tax=Cytobacillus sp. FSL M8-0252 TaxID=2921621 RepID=UPI0030FC6282
MRGAIGYGFFLMMSMVIMVFIPDLIVYGTLNYKANAITAQVTKEAEMQGGITNSVKSSYTRIENELGMNNKGFNISYENEGEIQQGGRFAIEYKGEYTFKAINLLGSGVGQFTLPISAKKSGISEVWQRNGG